MSKLRTFELGLSCILAALLNFMFGYWINFVLVVVGVLALVFSFLEPSKATTPEKT